MYWKTTCQPLLDDGVGDRHIKAYRNVLIRMLKTTNHKTTKARPLLSYKYLSNYQSESGVGFAASSSTEQPTRSQVAGGGGRPIPQGCDVQSSPIPPSSALGGRSPIGGILSGRAFLFGVFQGR
jgi:hypothetical protein